MRRAALAALATIALIGIPVANAQIESPKHFTRVSTPHQCTAQSFKPWAERVWRLIRWERKGGEPKDVVIAAKRKRIKCAPPRHKKTMRKAWGKLKHAFYKHRKAEFFRVRITPFYCNGTYWATECTVPLHESGYGSGGGNLYGMLDAWALHGCTEFAGSAWEASKRQQDICAHRHWQTYGRGGWPPY